MYSFYEKYEILLLQKLEDLKIEIYGDELKELDLDDWNPYYLPIDWIISPELRQEVCRIGESTPTEEQDSVIENLVADYISERRSKMELAQLELSQMEQAEYLDYWYGVQFEMEKA